MGVVVFFRTADAIRWDSVKNDIHECIKDLLRWLYYEAGLGWKPWTRDEDAGRLLIKDERDKQLKISWAFIMPQSTASASSGRVYVR